MTKLRTTGWFLLFVILLVALVNLAVAQETPTASGSTVFQHQSLTGDALAVSAEETQIELTNDRQEMSLPGITIQMSPPGQETDQEPGSPTGAPAVALPDEGQQSFAPIGSLVGEVDIALSGDPVQLDLSGYQINLPLPDYSPNATGDVCNQLLKNPKLDVVGSVFTNWVILEPKVYYSDEDYVSAMHSAVLVDNDGGDPSPTLDALAQPFKAPAVLTKVTIKYNTATLDSNAADEVWGNIYTVDGAGDPDEFILGWEVLPSPGAWQTQTLNVTDSALLNKMKGKNLIIILFNVTTGSAPGEVVFFDDVTFTACEPDPPNSFIIVKKLTNPAGATQKFTFDPSWSGTNFQLSHGQSVKSPALAPGTYKVTESIPSGWALQSATCSDGSSPNSISLAKGETVTCTFTNKKLADSQTCNQLLVNTQLNIVEFGDGTGTAEPWAILDPIVYYTHDPAEVYGGSGYSLFFEDGDSGDPNPKQDSLAQAFQMPRGLSEMRIEYQRATVNTNTTDKVFGNLWLLDENWVLHLDEPDKYFVMSWEVGQQNLTWVKETGSWKDAALLNKMNGRKMVIILYSQTDGGGTKEIALFDDVKLTACTKKAAGTSNVFMPVTMNKYGKASGPICNPPSENPADQWYSDRGLVQTNATCNSTLSNVDLADYYTFKPAVSGNYTLRLTNLPAGSQWAAMIFIDQASPEYAPGGAEDGLCRITQPGNVDKQVVCNLDKNKNYFVKVSSGSTPMGGSYRMRITQP